MSDRTDALKAADSGAWPPAGDEAAWEHLREWAFQWACLLVDIDESKAWVNAMATLAGQDLPHDEYTVTRLRMLSDRIRGRKLAQSALRWKFGFKTGRSEALIRRDIRTFHKEHRAQLH